MRYLVKNGKSKPIKRLVMPEGSTECLLYALAMILRRPLDELGVALGECPNYLRVETPEERMTLHQAYIAKVQAYLDEHGFHFVRCPEIKLHRGRCYLASISYTGVAMPDVHHTLVVGEDGQIFDPDPKWAGQKTLEEYQTSTCKIVLILEIVKTEP